MDSGTIFYIIAVVIYFIYSALQQKKNQPKEGDIPDGSQSGDPTDLPQKGTFEDLLREIRKGQARHEEDAPKPVERREKPAPVEVPSYREVSIPKEKTTTYPSTGGLAEKYGKYQSKQPLVKLDDVVDIHDDRKILGEVEGTTKTTRQNPYAKLLKDPKSLREAVVVAEILNRKHF
ncbi:hypothetical protein ADIS_3385 [Lunatimonas lonarensis]|uniref:Uncharacterized protein n=1 Tax=Lunatimonas lonarensis TaxID=1232681 RepID=R7ZQ97_9BACT|nr:hypothetical protein [Lunatimonas lonarensis]EON76257.1 hypothetical protein ADIS_3385 [Lunatimonas lonarensis]